MSPSAQREHHMKIGLTEWRVAVLDLMSESGPLTIEEVATHFDWNLEETRVDVAWCWQKDLLTISNGALPFSYVLTRAGDRKLAKARESTADPQQEALDGLCARFGDLVVVDDPGTNRRKLAVPVMDGQHIYKEGRWVYATGCIRRAVKTDAEALVEGRDDGDD